MLLLDNLMDVSHDLYLHAGILRQNAGAHPGRRHENFHESRRSYGKGAATANWQPRSDEHEPGPFFTPTRRPYSDAPTSLGAGAAATGALYVTDRFWDEAWLIAAHALLAWPLGLMIPLHIAGVIHASRRHRENLVGAM